MSLPAEAIEWMRSPVVERYKNPIYTALDEAHRLRKLNPDLFRVEFQKRFHDVFACFVLRNDEVPAVDATWGPVFFHPSPAFLEFLVALRAGNCNEV